MDKNLPLPEGYYDKMKLDLEQKKAKEEKLREQELAETAAKLEAEERRKAAEKLEAEARQKAAEKLEIESKEAEKLKAPSNLDKKPSRWSEAGPSKSDSKFQDYRHERNRSGSRWDQSAKTVRFMNLYETFKVFFGYRERVVIIKVHVLHLLSVLMMIDDFTVIFHRTDDIGHIGAVIEDQELLQEDKITIDTEVIKRKNNHLLKKKSKLMIFLILEEWTQLNGLEDFT